MFGTSESAIEAIEELKIEISKSFSSSRVLAIVITKLDEAALCATKVN